MKESVLALGNDLEPRGERRFFRYFSLRSLFRSWLTMLQLRLICSRVFAYMRMRRISFGYRSPKKFSIADWLVGAGDANGIKSITAFYPEGTSDLNVSVVITGIGPDFTRLESFGTVDAFAENLVNGLDRSWKRPPGLAAKLLNSKAANGLYYIEYTLQNPGERCRHILSAIGMASNGWYNRLYTVTGQFMEDESEKYRAQIEKSVSSFRLI